MTLKAPGQNPRRKRIGFVAVNAAMVIEKYKRMHCTKHIAQVSMLLANFYTGYNLPSFADI